MAVSSKKHNYILDAYFLKPGDAYFLNPGMAVRIRNYDWYRLNRDKYGVIKPSNPRDVIFTPEMSRHCGKIAHINKILKNDYTGEIAFRLKESLYMFSAYMFECIVE